MTRTFSGARSLAWPMTRSALAVAALVGVSSLVAPVAVHAQPQVDIAPQIASERENVVDPPGRAGRLAEVQGSAWLFHPDAGEWLAAERNRPFTTGDRLSTDQDGRAELRVGSTTLRLDANSEMEIVRLDDEHFEVYLHSGSLAVRLRSDEAASGFAMTTDQGSFVAQRSGRYRLDRRADLSVLTVASGQARYETTANALQVQAGQRAEFWLEADGRPQYQLTAPAVDRFAAWAAELDRNDAPALAQRYVSPEMTGAEDLDRYGSWEQDPDHGAVWAPRSVPAGWAPYAQGHWSWVAPWGWTWVDAQPWGFAPFHYGRWVYLRERWCWTPGRYVARPVYAPALVGWVGGSGGSVSVSIGGGPAVGWFPLAPGEAWFPRYRVSPRYVRVVNGPSFRNGAEIDRWILNPSNAMRGAEFRNRKFHHGTTLVPAAAFNQPARTLPVNPRWRGDQFARDLDRLPASPVATVAPPAWRRGNWEGRPAGVSRDVRSGWRRDGLPGRGPAPGVAGNGFAGGGAGGPVGSPTGGAVGGSPGGAVGGAIGGAAIGGMFNGAATAPRERPIDARPGDRPFERSMDRPYEPAGERGYPRADGGNGDWPSGRSRPALPPGSLPEPRPMPPAAALPVVPAPARIEAPEPDPRFNRPERPDRRFERPDRGMTQTERPQPVMPADVARPAPPVMQAPPAMHSAPPMPAPPVMRAAPPPMPAPPPPVAVAPPRPPEPARPAVAPPPPSSYVSPLQSRRPGEGREPPPGEREGGRGGRPQ